MTLCMNVTNKRQMEINAIQGKVKVLLHKMWKYFIPFDKSMTVCINIAFMYATNYLYCIKPHKIKGGKCALFSILCASVLYLTQKCSIISTSVLYYPFDSDH